MRQTTKSPGDKIVQDINWVPQNFIIPKIYAATSGPSRGMLVSQGVLARRKLPRVDLLR